MKQHTIIKEFRKEGKIYEDDRRKHVSAIEAANLFLEKNKIIAKNIIFPPVYTGDSSEPIYGDYVIVIYDSEDEYLTKKFDLADYDSMKALFFDINDFKEKLNINGIIYEGWEDKCYQVVYSCSNEIE